jgi:hypothetical protein
MKRIIIVCLVLALLVACQPTPEQEFVVNKGDDTVEQKLNETAGTDANAQIGVGRQSFPDRWDEEPLVEKDRLIVRVHADVHTRADGLYPVYRSRATEITQETIETVAVKFLDKPTAAADALMTKDDWSRELQHFLDDRARYEEWAAAGKPDGWNDVDEYEWTPEEIERETNRYMEKIKNAPDTLTSQAVNNYSGLEKGKGQSFKLASGETAWIFWSAGSYVIAKGCKINPILYPYDRYQDDLEWKEGNYKQWIEPSISREQAEATAISELERLGYTGFAVSKASQTTLLDGHGSPTSVAGGWQLVLRRDYGGYPQLARDVYASLDLQYGSDDAFVTSPHIEQEQFRLLVSEDGIRYLNYSGPKDISGLISANVELLPFDEIQTRIKNAMTTCFPYERWATDPNEDPRPVEAEIYELHLSSFTVHAKDSSDYYEMPCWIVVFDWISYVSTPWMTQEYMQEFRSDPGHGDCLIINAVDGSIVHEDFGY